MMDETFSYILAIAALVIGVMLLTGHGAVFMKGGNTQARSRKYDEKKMEKVSGICYRNRNRNRCIHNICDSEDRLCCCAVCDTGSVRVFA